MLIGAISDLHGNLIDIYPCEVLFICGDISPLRLQFNMEEMEYWITNEFLPWCEKLSCERIFLIAGNHDAFLERKKEKFKSLLLGSKVVYLENELSEYITDNGDCYKIFGTPYCHIFGNWPFMRTDEVLKNKFFDIPEDCDIVFSHDCPFGTGDVCLELNEKHRGSIPLRDAIIRSKPRYLFTGHLHSANHNCEILEDTEVYNTSIVDERYEVSYEPLYLNI
jgi:Icc-related predicted phosphoesterase